MLLDIIRSIIPHSLKCPMNTEAAKDYVGLVGSKLRDDHNEKYLHRNVK